eukprot:2855275-Rhodomonas_salina.5
MQVQTVMPSRPGSKQNSVYPPTESGLHCTGIRLGSTVRSTDTSSLAWHSCTWDRNFTPTTTLQRS